jgi:Tfp pilus assembly protein FimV
MSDKNGGAPAKPDVEALRAEIKQTRAELGETVQALAAKADVKARAKEQVEQTKQRVKAQAAEATTKVRDAAAQAGERVRAAAGQAAEKTGQVAGQAGDKVGQVAGQASDRVRVEPVAGTDVAINGRRLPVPLLVAGVAALVGIILVVRGSRR